ncbi:hypothetical protein Taro_010059 [Colocasia esculenta]|uniref:Ethylene insensitive 3-like DNA-binding domain-containing protein n=1 Tax=Colocasia esculenta TaxID=4460 RepID=A0A843U6L5_COLES|nr:hypothetical protein [Colocasia esculenta]
MEHLAMFAPGLGDSSGAEADDFQGVNFSENDVSDEEFEAEELTARMNAKNSRCSKRRTKPNPSRSSNQARRKKDVQSGRWDSEIFAEADGTGFVCGFIPEKGKPVSRSSDNIRDWWKEKVKFDKNGPAAIAKAVFLMMISDLPVLDHQILLEETEADVGSQVFRRALALEVSSNAITKEMHQLMEDA